MSMTSNGNSSFVSTQYKQALQSSNKKKAPSMLQDGLIIGFFMRGRLDRPMRVTLATLRARLGYEPANPCYVAVSDCLNAGVPSVWVMRVSGNWFSLPDVFSASLSEESAVSFAVGDAILGGDKLTSLSEDSAISFVVGDAILSEDKLTDISEDSAISFTVGDVIMVSSEFIVPSGVGDRLIVSFEFHDAVLTSYQE